MHYIYINKYILIYTSGMRFQADDAEMMLKKIPEAHPHTRQEWIIVAIRQELNPVTCKLDGKQTNLRRILRIMEVLLSDHHVLNR